MKRPTVFCRRLIPNKDPDKTAAKTFGPFYFTICTEIPKYRPILTAVLCCGVGTESQGAEIKLPPAAGAKITNCGSGSCFFLFFTDQKIFYRKKSCSLKKCLSIDAILILLVKSKK
jgi:hypothetical protein